MAKTKAGKWLRRVEDAALDQGWRIEQAKSGHIKFFAPDHETIITTSKTPGDIKALRAIGSQFRRAGMELPTNWLS